MFVKIYPSSVAFLLAATLLVSPLHADTVISTDTTQDGGTLPVDPPILAVTSNTTTPVLTLTNSATASFTGATVVGALLEESGSLRILNGSTMTVSGDGTPIRPYGSLSVYYGDGILGLNGDAQGTALVSGTGSVWTMRHLAVGAMGNGNLTVENGGHVLSASSGLSADPTIQGSVLVRGAGSQWVNSGFLSIGAYGVGTLRIETGGSASSGVTELGFLPLSSGSVVVTGGGSQWTTANLTVGNEGTGHVQVENGGSASSAHVTLAAANNGLGEAVVTGAGSQWGMSGDLTLGVGSGTGNLTIENGGTVENQFATVGDTGQGEVIVTGVDSTWDIQENLIVGRQGGGTLHVTGSGIVSSKNAHIGSEAGSSGFVEITGSDSAWTGRAISVGFEGTGNLQIENGGRLNNTDSYLGRAAGGQGTATVSGTDSLWKMSGGLTIGGTNSTSGELTVEDGGTVQVMGTLLLHANGSLVIGTNATMDVSDDMESAGDILLHDGTLTVQSVLIQSGGSIGAMGSFSLVDGDLILASGSGVRFSLTSTLSVSGSVTLDSSFGVASLIGLDQSAPIGSYTLIDGTTTDFSQLGIQNWGLENAYDLGGGKAAYFRQGSLVVEVIPEPGTGALFLLAGGAILLRRRRERSKVENQ